MADPTNDLDMAKLFLRKAKTCINKSCKKYKMSQVNSAAHYAKSLIDDSLYMVEQMEKAIQLNQD